MLNEKEKPKKCAKCGKKFSPTIERRLTCEQCYRSNTNVSPLAEEPDRENKKKRTEDFSVFHMIRNSPVTLGDDE